MVCISCIPGSSVQDYLEEKIVLQMFASSEALKEEIGARVRNRIAMDWDFVNIFSKGPYLYLAFRHRDN